MNIRGVDRSLVAGSLWERVSDPRRFESYLPDQTNLLVICSVQPVTAKAFFKRFLRDYEHLISEDRKAGVLMALEKLDGKLKSPVWVRSLHLPPH